jgi:DNA polymerase III delta prime subunit
MNTRSLTEVYRPSKLADCVLPKRIKTKLEKWKLKMPNHLIFHGNSGIGKTSTALALAKELSPDDHVVINASKDNSVDFINNYLLRCMCASLSRTKRIIILDEADQLTEKAQTSLRRPLEEYAHISSIIFTYNYTDKIIEPLKSRCFQFDFNISDFNEKKEMKIICKKRLQKIIKAEKIDIENIELEEIVNQNYPDIRKCINQLELY